jgi:hypothetical protein
MDKDGVSNFWPDLSRGCALKHCACHACGDQKPDESATIHYGSPVVWTLKSASAARSVISELRND